MALGVALGVAKTRNAPAAYNSPVRCKPRTEDCKKRLPVGLATQFLELICLDEVNVRQQRLWAAMAI